MIEFITKANQERLDFARQREQRAAEQHQVQVRTQEASLYREIISDLTLPADVREEARNSLIKLLRND